MAAVNRSAWPVTESNLLLKLASTPQLASFPLSCFCWSAALVVLKSNNDIKLCGVLFLLNCTNSDLSGCRPFHRETRKSNKRASRDRKLPEMPRHPPAKQPGSLCVCMPVHVCARVQEHAHACLLKKSWFPQYFLVSQVAGWCYHHL